MGNFRQLNRAYDNMLENRYLAQLEAAEYRQEFIDNLISEYKASSWSEQIELLSAYMENYDFETANDCEKIMISVLDHPLISKALNAAMSYIAETEYEQLSDDDNEY